METIVVIALTAAVFVTALGVFARTTKQLIRLLSIQAALVGIVELAIVFVDLVTGLRFEALIDFFATSAEWLASAAVSPLIIYWGMVRTENVAERPITTIRRSGILIVAIIAVNTLLGIFASSFLPARLYALPFATIMFSLAVVIIVTRADPLKTIIGLNMAENALYPTFAESPLVTIPFMLGAMIFTNVVGIFIVVEAYRDFGVSSIKEWKWSK